MQVNECWVDDLWDEEKFNDLVGLNKAIEIIQLKIQCNSGSNVYVWKPTINGQFTTASAWEVTRLKDNTHEWMEWVW